MNRYIIKRIGYLILTMFAASVFIFVSVNAIPGETAEILAKHLFIGIDEIAPPEMIQEVSARYNLDRPLLEQYFTWVMGILRGDLGHSIYFNRPVSVLIKESIFPTLLLSVTSLTASILIGIPTGIYAAIRENKISDHLVRLLTIFSISMPSFWIAVMLILVLSIWLDLTPVAGYGRVEYLILPTLALAIHMMASIARIMRISILETMEKPFITYARAKGLGVKDVIMHHLFKNSLLPVITVIGIAFGGLLSGTVVIETIFSWPGLGSLLLKAINARDLILIESTILVIVFLFMIVNFAVDLLYHALDPRIKYE